MEKINKKIFLSDIDLYDIEGNLEDIIEMFIAMRNPEYTSIKVKAEIAIDDDEAFASLAFYGHREETDEEFDKRLNDDARIKLRKYLNKNSESKSNTFSLKISN